MQNTIYNKIRRCRMQYVDQRTSLGLIMSELCIDGKPMEDKDATAKLIQMSKVAHKNVKIYQEAGKFGAAIQEKDFATLVETFLPPSATIEDIREAISKLSLEPTMKSMGQLMGYLKGKFEVVDGALVKSVLINK